MVNALQQVVPEAELLLLGTTDGYANIHAPNERVLIEEFEKAVIVEAEFLGRFAAAFAARDTTDGACARRPPPPHSRGLG